MKESHISIFSKGMHRDSTARNQPEATYYDALNAVLETEEGDLLSISNELGNELCASLPNRYKLIGYINTDNEEVIVFSTNNVFSEIGIFNSECCTYETLINTQCLNFSTCNLIKGIYKVRRGCERIIYFTDKVNPLRVINLDKLSEYTDENGNFDCTQTAFRPDTSHPQSIVEVRNSGGNLPIGSYSFVFRYIDNQGNTTQWSPATNPVYVTDDPLSQPWTEIDGAYNIESHSPEEGGVPLTNKSIRISLQNLDQDFSQVQVGVIVYRQGIGTLSEIELLSPQNYNTDFVYTYTGSVNQVVGILSTNELEVDPANIQVVETIAQLDNTLWLANIKTSAYDFSAFQQAASQIVIKPVIKQVDARDATQEHNAKHFLNRTAMGGDVEEFGIVYYFRNGSKSPVFHIPGREAFAGERDILNTWTPDMSHITDEITFNDTYAKNEEEFSANPNAEVVRAFEVCPPYTSGEFLYYENKQGTYPDTTNCEGEPVWRDLAGRPIRHHKFPTRKNVNLVEIDEDGNLVLNVFGVEVTNVSYPHPDIIGHTIVRAKKTEDNTYIRDKAIVFESFELGGQILPSLRPSTVGGGENQVLDILSPQALVTKLVPSFSHLHLEATYDLNTRTIDGIFDTPGFLSRNIHFRVTQMEGEEFSQLFSRCNINIDTKALVSFNSVQPAFGNFENDLFNDVQTDSTLFLSVKEDSIWGPEFTSERILPVLAALYTNNDVFNNLFNLTYEAVSNNVHYGTDTPILYNINGGSIFPLEWAGITNYDSSSSIWRRDFKGAYFPALWIESPYNLAYRHGGTSKCNLLPRNFENILFFFMNQIADQEEGSPTDWLLRDRGNQCQNFWGYNLDFSRSQESRVDFPLRANYDFCSNCLNHFPNRIYYSLRDDLETVGDNYRLVNANNYRILDTTGDYFTALMVDKSELYALSNAYAYFIPTKTQQLQADENTIYIGTGDRLSIPPTKMVSTDYRYGGTVADFTIVKTPFGIIYADPNAGVVYMLSDALKEISNNGMRSFFENDLDLKWDKLVKRALGVSWNCNNSAVHSLGIGLHATYDPRHLRYLLSKRDYMLVDSLIGLRKLEEDTVMEPNYMYIDEDQKLYVLTALGNRLQIPLGDYRYFKEVNWTISYSFLSNSWSSFHSYGHQGLTLNDNNTFFSTLENQIWQHNKGAYGIFYDTIYPHFIEFVSNGNPLNNKIFDNVTVTSNAFIDGLYADKTYDSFWAYTSRQSTGLINLDHAYSMSSVGEPNTVKVREIKDKYNFSLYRNRLIQLPSFRYDSPHRTIENIGNYQMLNDARLKGDYLNIRLYANNTDNIKLTNVSTIVNYTTSNR